MKQLLVFTLLVATVVASMNVESIQLCGCPDSACPNRCAEFEIGKCTLMYQCFLEANNFFAYIRPERTANENELIVNVYNDPTCSGEPRFDSSDPLTGWQGSCDSNCWGGQSKIGAGPKGCFDESSATNSKATRMLLLLLSLTVVTVGYMYMM
mmetsp:Transcript_22597/g.46882  ORF Transcript_22597/g.46882 Transcript_22597/m.46882 type:complete len:153 (+) Transcript_22597:112-570(+)